jgi:hypothetical protein
MPRSSFGEREERVHAVDCAAILFDFNLIYMVENLSQQADKKLPNCRIRGHHSDSYGEFMYFSRI